MRMTDTQSPKEIKEHMKYCCAKEIYRSGIAESLTPRSQRTSSKKKKVLWKDWFLDMFGEDYYVYINRKIEEKRNA